MLRDNAVELFDDQRDRAAAEVGAVGELLLRSAQSLKDRGDTTVARYADQAGRQIGAFADSLQGRSWDELAANVEDFAQRNPLVLAASAVCLGLVAGRFLITTAPEPGETDACHSPSTRAGGVGAEPAVAGTGIAPGDAGAVPGTPSPRHAATPEGDR